MEVGCYYPTVGIISQSGVLFCDTGATRAVCSWLDYCRYDLHDGLLHAGFAALIVEFLAQISRTAVDRLGVF